MMRKILLIDDSALSRNMFKRSLGENYIYLEATEGMEGLELYFLERPDLVVLDLTMPGTNGLVILDQLKKLDPQAKVIIGSADVQRHSQREAERLGARGFIIKPFTPENVEPIVSQALAEVGS